MFIVSAIAGYALLGLVALLDKFILSKKVSHPLAYTFYIAIPFLFLLLFLPFGIKFPGDIYGWGGVISGGLFYFLGLWLMFAGIQKSEISHVGPLVGASVTLSTVLLGWIFLGETLPFNGLVGVGLLVFGSLLISHEKSKKHNGFHFGMLEGVLSGIFFAISYTTSKYCYDALGFYSGLVLTRGMLGLLGLCLLSLPFVRREIFLKNKVKRLPKQNRVVVFANLIFSAVAVFLIQYAVSVGSVSVVSAFEGLKYAILIILVALLSKFFPKILKEDYAKGEMRQEILAVCLIGLGLVLLI